MRINGYSRRALALLLGLLLSIVLASNAAPAHKGEYIFYVGTYTEEGSKSKGIYAYRFDADTAEITPLGPAAEANGRAVQTAARRDTAQITPLGLAAETTNPSWLAISPNGRFLYAVNEVGNYKGPNSGGLSAFSIDRDEHGRPTGKLSFLNEVATRGPDPCYVTIDQSGKYALVANYTGGSVIVFPIRENGRLGEASDFVQHTGHGTNPKRQEGPHAHSIDLSPDNRFAYVDDLGLDELLVYKFDSAKGTLTPNDPPFVRLDAGAGPRHFATHPSGKFAYVVSEMQGSVTAFSNDAPTGRLERLQTISTLPGDFKGEIEDAEVAVHPSGKFLYASNRGKNSSVREWGANSIAIFAIDADKGTLRLFENTTTVGKTPRSFEIDPTGTYLLAANQGSNNIVVFRINQNDDGLHVITKAGHLSPGQVLDVAVPVCVKFLKVD